MDCDYIFQNELHEQFLLHRLAEAEKDAYETHVNECAACRNAQLKQLKVIQGIREVGREDLKAEITRQVQHKKSGLRLGWSIPVKVAAALLVLVLSPGLYFLFQKYESPTLQVERVELQEERLQAYDNMTIQTEQRSSAYRKQMHMDSASPVYVIPRDLDKAKNEVSGASKRAFAEEQELKEREEEVGAAIADVKDEASVDSQPGGYVAGREYDENLLDDIEREPLEGAREVIIAPEPEVISLPVEEVQNIAPDTTFSFIISGRNISLRLFLRRTNQYRSATGELASEFPVQIMSPDYMTLIMDCYVDETVFTAARDSIHFDMLNDDTFAMSFGRKQPRYYLIDMKESNSTAKLR